MMSQAQTNRIPCNVDSISRGLKKTPIQVIQINDPGEFYIHLVEHIPGIVKFEEKIQNRLVGRIPQENTIWNQNDHCLVLTSVDQRSSDKWYRGIIIKVDENESENLYSVFLRDHGLVIEDVSSRQLMRIDDDLDRETSGAILCHLACLHPTEEMNKWSSSAVNEFLYIIYQFDSIGATVQGITKNGSIPVVLWGIETNADIDPCNPSNTNINQMLFSSGLAFLTEEIDINRQKNLFVPSTFDPQEHELHENVRVINATHNLNYDELVLMAKSKLVTEWLHPEPIDKTLFTAYPTYVDYDGTVYLHDAMKHKLLNNMCKVINQDIDLISTNYDNDDWTTGEACLARYHLDNYLYRAVIKCCLPNKRFIVRFVDYGNEETCHLIDLYRITPFASIPIQAVPFSIDGIPLNDSGQQILSVSALDLIHGVIVDRLCGIQVCYGQEHEEIKKCRIRFNGQDLTNYLIHNNIVTGPH